MATVTDVEVANASFPNVRQDLNDILEALATNFSADAEPSTMYANQFWYETDTNLLKFRNEDNDAWITLAYFDQTADEWEVRSAVMQAVDAAGLAFKTDEGTTRLSISDAGQVSFQNYSFPTADGTSGQVLITDGAGNLSFGAAAGGDSISEGNSSVEVVDTGTGYVAVTVDGSEIGRFDSGGLDIDGDIQAGENHRFVALDGDGDVSIEIRNQASGSNSAIIGADPNNTGSATNLTFSVDGNEQVKINNIGELKFNSGYGSVATAYGCRAWVNFSGVGTVSIRDSGNVSSITDNGTGNYTVNFTTAMPDANYSVSGMTSDVAGTGNRGLVSLYTGVTAPAVGSFRIFTHTNTTQTDNAYIFCSVFR